MNMYHVQTVFSLSHFEFGSLCKDFTMFNKSNLILWSTNLWYSNLLIDLLCLYRSVTAHNGRVVPRLVDLEWCLDPWLLDQEWCNRECRDLDLIQDSPECPVRVRYYPNTLTSPLAEPYWIFYPSASLNWMSIAIYLDQLFVESIDCNCQIF